MIRWITCFCLLLCLITSAQDKPIIVNVNHASAKELETVPNIGPVLAKKIIEDRKANGPYKSVDELVRVSGIGHKSILKLMPYLTVGVVGKLDINTATVNDLDRLPGIGETLAKRILDYRKTNGPFKTVDDLTKVTGVSASAVAKFRNRVMVGGKEKVVPKPDEMKDANRHFRPAFK